MVLVKELIEEGLPVPEKEPAKPFNKVPECELLEHARSRSLVMPCFDTMGRLRRHFRYP